MTGRTKYLLDSIIEARSQGNTIVGQATKTKLILKGINPNHFASDTEDDPAIIAQVLEIAKELGVTL